MAHDFLHSSQSPSSVQRKPFLRSNAFIGIGLVSFAFAVYSYSIYAVKQDKFEDVEKQLEQARKK